MKNLIPSFILERSQSTCDQSHLNAYTMFIDISGFTAMTQQLMENGKEGAEVLTEVINRVFSPAIDAIYQRNGFISIFAGDAFTAIFPEDQCHPEHVLAAGIQIQQKFTEEGLQQTKFGDFQLSVKVGISFGDVEWRIIRNEYQNTYYFRGDGVDGCAYSEHHSEKGEIIIDSVYYEKAQSAHLDWELSPKEDGYRRVESANLRNMPLTNNQDHSFEESMFVPDIILNMMARGEFRDIISCFISFEEREGFASDISKVISLANEYGGYFNKVDFGDKGGVILALFGAPLSKEKLFQRAADFALAVQQIHGFSCRIGLTYGTVFAGFVGSEKRQEYTALGSVVNLSARFMMKAQFGEIYISGEIARNLDTGAYTYQELEALQLKGFAEKVPAFLLEKRRMALHKKPEMQGKMVGRSEEIKTLESMFEPIFEGKFGGIVYVDGRAGIGKSRLINEVQKKIENQVDWLYFPCDEILQKSFNPAVHFLYGFFQQSDDYSPEENKHNFDQVWNTFIPTVVDPDIHEELVRTKSFLAALLNIHWENSLYSQLDAKSRFQNTLYALKTLIRAKALSKPVVIELEDGHWLDADSLKWLKMLIQNMDNVPVIIVSACRFNDDGSHFRFPLKEVTENRLSLDFLSEAGAREFLMDRLQTLEIPEDTISFIYKKTEGNPFFIEQILLYLQEKQLFDESYNLQTKSFSIPASINAIIIARVDRLATELKEMVRTASVLGREFAINILSAMLENRHLQPYLVQGEQEIIWNSLTEIQYIFQHALIRESVYQMQLRKTLRELHKLAAETIEDLYGNDLLKFYADLANHFEKAEVNDKAKLYLDKAGDLAKENYQNEQALQFYKRLLNLLTEPGTEKRVTVLLKKGRIENVAGLWDEAVESFRDTLEEARSLQKNGFIAEAYNRLGRQLHQKGVHEKVMHYWEEALDLYHKENDKNGQADVLRNIGLFHEGKGDYDEAMATYEKMLKLSEQNQYAFGIMTALGNMGKILKNRGEYDKALQYFQKHWEMATEVNDRREIAVATGNIAIVYYNQGEYDKALEYYGKQYDICQKTGFKKGAGNAIGNIGVLLYARGQYEEASESFEKQLWISEELGNKQGIFSAVVNIGNIYFSQGNFKRAQAYYERGFKLGNQLGFKRGIAIVAGNLGVIHWRKGDEAAAIGYFEQQQELGEAMGDKREVGKALVNRGNLFFEKGHYEKALNEYQAYQSICQELGDQQGIAFAMGNLGNVYMEKGDFAMASDCFEKRLEIGKILESDQQVALALGALAGLNREKGFLEKALKNYDDAIEMAEKMGEKNFLSEFYTEKADLLYAMQNYDEARRIYDTARNLAREIQNEAQVLKNEILSAKLAYVWGSEGDAIEKLEAMWNADHHDLHKAEIGWALWQLDEQKIKPELAALLEKLYQITPRIKYKAWLKELE